MSNIKYGMDYRLFPSEKTGWIGVELLTGKYAGVRSTYGKVGAEINEEQSGELVLSFEFDIENPAIFEKEKLEEDLEFQNTLGDVLQSIIIDQIEHDMRKESANNETSS
jgi:hypothetical protein